MNNVLSPIVMVTNSVFPTQVAKSEISQSLYKDEYRSSMGSFKSLIGSLLYSIFAVLVGLVADWKGAVFAAIYRLQTERLFSFGLFFFFVFSEKRTDER